MKSVAYVTLAFSFFLLVAKGIVEDSLFASVQCVS